MRGFRQLLFLTAFLLIAGPLANASAQDASTPLADPAAIGVLAEFDIAQLPPAPAAVILVRTTVEPGFESSVSAYPGTLVVLVEAGTIILQADNQAMVAQPGEPATEGDGDITMETGASVLVPEETSASYANQTDQPAHVLMLLLGSESGQGQGEDNSGEIIQMANRGLAIGYGQFPPMQGSVLIERVVAQPGETIEGPGVIFGSQMPSWMGVDMGIVETGSAELQVTQRSMENMIMPNAGTGMLSEPVIFTLSATESLQGGDSYTTYNSAVSWTVAGNDPLTILRVIVAPDFFP